MFARLLSSLAGLLVLACTMAALVGLGVLASVALGYVLAMPPLLAVLLFVTLALALVLELRALIRAGLQLPCRTSDRHTFNLLAFHSPHSLTWSWILSAMLPRSPDEGRWIGAWTYRTNGGRQFGFQFMRCQLTLHRQRPMLYREMWRRDRDQRDGLACA